MQHLGYGVYFLTILGVWKILGVAALLIPRFPLLQEWAFAGFVFAMTGAVFSHIAVGDPVKEPFPCCYCNRDWGILVFPACGLKNRAS
jgi:hypothetical protein